MNITEMFSNALYNVAKENPLLITAILLLVMANMVTKRKSL